MLINYREVIGTEFAYDGCHKIYVLEDVTDKQESMEIGYHIYPIGQLEEVYENSCSLRFINNWKCDKTYVGQFESAVFEGV